MIACINILFIFIFREPLFAIRLASLFCLGSTLFFIYKSSFLYSGNKENAAQTTLFFLLIPYIFIVGITMQVEQPLLLFSSMIIYFFLKLEQTLNVRYWYILAMVSALCLLSKYTGVLLIVFLFGYILYKKELRQLVRSKEFLISLVLFFLALLPLILWNMQNQFISLSFHAARLGTQLNFSGSIDFLLEQILYFSPFGLFYLIKAIKKQPKHLFLILGLFIFISFLFLSMYTKVWGHWTAIMYIPLAIYIGIILNGILIRANILQGFFTILLVVILLFTGPAVLIHYPKIMKNYSLGKNLEPIIYSLSDNLSIISDFHGSVGQLSYYLNKTVYFPQGEFKNPAAWGSKQFSLWFMPKIKTNDNVLFFTKPDEEKIAHLKKIFKEVEVLPNPVLTVMEGHINEKRFLLCKSARFDFIF